ncbi:MAG: ribosomal subunit interface protein [Lentisphaerae bacterium GWF2_57_35]|nr:MAG: ribosomal subunit interface protein [Lentisphaerae bacterium GWF2_57_35]
MEITDAIRDYVHEKIQHELVEFPRTESVHMILNVEKYRQIAEVVVQAPNHVRVEAREESDDLYASIDASVEKMVKQMKRKRDTVQNHKSRESIAQVELEVQAATKETEII